MDKSKTLTILKNAILIERKGKSLYQKAMDNASDEAVKSFFKDLVDDEQEHINILEKQFMAYIQKGQFIAAGFEESDSEVKPTDILNEELKEKIGAASFEATAITAAISFEEKAIKMYSKRAEEAVDPEEKKMYKWLSVWERTHLKKLVTLEESLVENVWNDNSFWPF
jgi:rubrerythrin